MFSQIVAFLGMLIYKFYGNEVGEMFGYEQHPHGFYSMAGMFFILSTNSSLYTLTFTS